jgi:hypothetical protein
VMTAPVIQLSERAVHAQQQSEPRMEAMVFLGELRQRAHAARVFTAQGDALAALRQIKGIEQMVEVGYEEVDRLTLKFGYPEGDDAA